MSRKNLHGRYSLVQQGCISLIVLLAECTVAHAQTWALPDVGQIIRHSKDIQYLTVDRCVLGFDKVNNHLICADARLVSISRPAESFNLTNSASLTCPDGTCYVTFPYTATATITADWIMPSEALTGDSILLSWQTVGTVGIVRWRLNWCQYVAGEVPCVPGIDDNTSFQTTTVNAPATYRLDTTVNPWPWSKTWAPSGHMVFSVSRDGYSPSNGDTLGADVLLRTVRIELMQ